MCLALGAPGQCHIGFTRAYLDVRYSALVWFEFATFFQTQQAFHLQLHRLAWPDAINIEAGAAVCGRWRIRSLKLARGSRLATHFCGNLYAEQ